MWKKCLFLAVCLMVTGCGTEPEEKPIQIEQPAPVQMPQRPRLGDEVGVISDQAGVTYYKNGFGEIDKIVCDLQAMGKVGSLQEVKPLIMEYFPFEIAKENFVYDHGTRFTNDAGSVLYGWQYKSNGKNFYKGRFPYDGNFVVMAREENGQVVAFGMFLGKNQTVPFLPDVSTYRVEPYDEPLEN